ncbi:hypothetical protein O3597_14250 [Verrucosispora sp. WMMA2044]|uniref:Uncharacterized protein n=1 Tax=Verrucosispora sioxanthis TaxID=2499994 RepID=A0A6M1LD89_9ACTN|nr:MULTISPECIES: hypothetical protein [Micromonospora]NEE67140.1 hypothetical protein [Verrucosispora sioxanthis]NGM16250.1 hypothetical protein [Verrucosispora sioxanthis]WBB51557.1 hypothetical protein O3597_14250 [Verrucosispora sp. WMMA2044]
MPLHLPDPPNSVADVRSKLHKFADEGKFASRALRSARKEQLDVSTPHQVFTMGLDSVLAGGGVDRAEPAGWRYLIEDGGQPVASAETTTGPDGTEEVAQFTEGPFVAATDKAMKIIRKLPKLTASGFELRLLRIPAVYQMALWLHSDNEDLIVPLEPSSIGKEGKAMPADEFFTDLAELARTTSFRTDPN